LKQQEELHKLAEQKQKEIVKVIEQNKKQEEEKK